MMKKLSEIPMDECICIGGVDRLMKKEDYLDSAYFLDKEDFKIYEADKTIQSFSWDDVVEWLEDEQYEDWSSDVFYEIKKRPELKHAAEIVNEIFSNHPTYWEGKEIVNDMISGE